MAYLTNPVTYQDSPNLNAFSRLRVSDLTTLFDSDLQYNLSPNFWQSVLTSGGTAASVANQSSCLMTVTSTTGSQVVRQTYKYFRYQPGKSQMIVMTGVMGAVVANVTKHIGYFDAQNGVGFYQDGTNTGVFVRTYTGGSASDTLIAQSSWNVDKMDGSGPSGITLDFSKTQIFVMDLQWLGVGRVRYGFNVNGVIYYCHYRNNANTLTIVYMTSANLPLRYDITNNAGGAGATMTQICSTVMSESGVQITNGRDFAVGNGITTIGVTTRRPILSIQPAATFNSLTNRTDTALGHIEIYADAAIYWELVYGNTTNSLALTGASFAAVNSGSGGSAVNYDVAATAISGGIVVASGYIGSAKQSSFSIGADLATYFPFGLDAAGSNPNTWTIVITSLSGTANSAASFNWTERR